MIALLVIHFVVRSFYIPSESMQPTLDVNDFILVNELIYNFTAPQRGDIIVFHPTSAHTGDNADLIKRVVGIENDKIELKDGSLFLNDIKIQEEFVLDPINSDYSAVVVQKDHVFVMGDNRNNSRDSRYIGQIPLHNVTGRAELVFYPLKRWRSFHFPKG